MSFKRWLKRATHKDYVVYWPRLGTNNYSESTFDEPVQLRCRWEDWKADFVDREGKIFVSKAKIFMDEQVAFGGRLYHGKLEDLVDMDNPQKTAFALEIRQVQRQSNFENNTVLWIVMV